MFGQGVAHQDFSLKQIPGCHTGGTVRIVIKNHVGFTTCTKHASKTHYSIGTVKMLTALILYVDEVIQKLPNWHSMFSATFSLCIELSVNGLSCTLGC